MRLTGEISRVVMDRWGDLMERSLALSKVECYMLAKYVNDIDLATSVIPEGYTWAQTGEEWRLEYNQNRWEIDGLSNESGTERTMGLIMEQGDRLMPGIKLTCDLPERHSNGRCLVLDIAVWSENSGAGGAARIRYTFFEKEISAPTVFHSKAAFSWRSKLVTLSEELRHRYRNTDRFHSDHEVESIVTKLLGKMANSGYGQSTRNQVLRSATVKYYREVLDSMTEGKKLYRTS